MTKSKLVKILVIIEVILFALLIWVTLWAK